MGDSATPECTAPACSSDGLRYCTADGRWIACAMDQICQDGACVDDSATPECTAPACSSDGLRYCTADGHWIACAMDQICQDGACADCVPGRCSEDGRSACADGAWQACGEAEICLEGACVEATCAAPACSSSGTSACVSGRWQLCAAGQTCQDGACVDRGDTTSLGYHLCVVDSDCGAGNCLKHLTLNRLDALDGARERVYLSELDSRIQPGEGVCSRDCTSSNICAAGETCQVVHGGASPYPAEVGVLPIDDLDLDEMAKGLPFAAMCRPSLQSQPSLGEAFCQQCATTADCGSGLFCDTDTIQPIAGVCLKTCAGDAECPFGFSCENALADEDGVQVCRPIAGTCGACLDRDSDGQGLGHCQEAGVDCDDADGEVGYSQGAPALCAAAADINCNGLDDRGELLGSADHCADCGDVCTGNVDGFANGMKQCQKALEDASTHTCVAGCANGFGDCDGDLAAINSNGCEYQFIDDDKWGPDLDGDGHGDPAAAIFCCPQGDTTICYQGTSEAQWVRADKTVDMTWIAHDSGKIDDCDDRDASTHPGAIELCDAKDNDCDGAADNDVHDWPWEQRCEGDGCKNAISAGVIGRSADPFGVGSTCSTELSGICNAGTWVCEQNDASSYPSHYYCPNVIIIMPTDPTSPKPNHCTPQYSNASPRFYCKPLNSPVSETCNGLDDDCDGEVDEDVPGVGTACMLKANDLPDIHGECRKGHYICGVYTDPELGYRHIEGQGDEPIEQDDGNFVGLYCDLDEPADYDFYATEADTNCDGFRGDMINGVFVAPSGISACSGSDTSGDGSAQSPFATLTKAVENACVTLTSGENAGKVLCRDIYVSKDVQEVSRGLSFKSRYADALHPRHTAPHIVGEQVIDEQVPLYRIHGGRSFTCDNGQFIWNEQRDESARSSYTLQRQNLNRFGAAITFENRDVTFGDPSYLYHDPVDDTWAPGYYYTVIEETIYGDTNSLLLESMQITAEDVNSLYIYQSTIVGIDLDNAQWLVLDNTTISVTGALGPARLAREGSPLAYPYIELDSSETISYRHSGGAGGSSSAVTQKLSYVKDLDLNNYFVSHSGQPIASQAIVTSFSMSNSYYFTSDISSGAGTDSPRSYFVNGAKGGLPGATGGGAIGILMISPKTGEATKRLEIRNAPTTLPKLIQVQGGQGGQGGKGQVGGAFYLNGNLHDSTGGGGGGAGGHGGNAYGILVACRQPGVSVFENARHLADCGLEISQSLTNAADNHITATGGQGLEDGEPGTDGIWPRALDEYPNGQIGEGGEGGSKVNQSNTNSGETALIYFLKDNDGN